MRWTSMAAMAPAESADLLGFARHNFLIHTDGENAMAVGAERSVNAVLGA